MTPPPRNSSISKLPNLSSKNWLSIRPSLRLPQPERNSPIALPQHENQQDPQWLAEVGEKIDAAEASIAHGEGVDFDSAMEQIFDRSPNLMNEQRSSRTALPQCASMQKC
jgi:hypothetical protein